MNICYQVQLSGVVQGVYFRASAQQKAIEFSLSGYAHNLDNGNVEVLICGEQDNVMKMLAWLERGPETAKVENCTANQVKWRDVSHFSIG